MTQVAVGNQIFNYQEFEEDVKYGRSHGSPLLIFHGWGRSGSEWSRMAKELSKWSGRKTYVLDLPGFGGSSLPEVATLDEYVDLVLQFCDYLDIKKVVLVCHSLGARVGIVWASGKRKEMVEKLVLVDPAGPKEFSLKHTILRIAASIFSFVPEEIRLSLIGRFLDEDYRNAPGLRKLYRVVVASDLRDNLAHIAVPVRLVWGELDKIVPKRMIGVYKKYLRDIRVRIVWGVGHDPHIDKYEQTLSILQENIE